MKKRIVSILCLCFLCICVLAACGGEISGTTTAAPGTTGTTATAPSATTSAPATTAPDYGSLSIADAEVTFSLETPVIPVFSREEWEEDITYSFDGNNIAIEHGVITGLVPGTQTLVTAKTEHHEAAFTVKVNYLDGVLTKPDGAEAKLTLAIPADADRYVSFTTVDVETWRENGFTRISSFAYNGTDNSWYNIEMNEAGQVHLYARFNGVEKYSIYLFHKNDPGIMVDGKIHYTVALYRNGQRTCLFVNDQLVCYFNEREMAGYDTLGDLQMTAAADRANAGEYHIAISQHYYSTDTAVCDQYEARYKEATSVPKQEIDILFVGDSYMEFWRNYNQAAQMTNFTNSYANEGIGGTTVPFWIGKASEMADIYAPKSIVFHVSVNDIDYGADVISTVSNLKNLFAIYHDLFPDATIYWNSLIPNTMYASKVPDYYSVNAQMKDYASTQDWLIYIEQAPSFEKEPGVANSVYFSDGLHLSSAIGYPIWVKNMMVAMGYPCDDDTLTKQDAVLENAEGNESKFSYGDVTALYGDFLFTAKVSINAYVEGWTRTSAFAFNGSDNSWYSVETDSSGNFTLFARFNGREKYWIHLFNKNDPGIIVDGKIQYTVALLKQGQATWFFVNDKLVCSFSAQEMEGYASLQALEVTALANRIPGAYSVEILDTKFAASDTEDYGKYWDKANFNFGDSNLSNNAGYESKVYYGNVVTASEDFVYTAKVSINTYVQNWTRTSAFAFNGSNNSWYTVETDASGNFTLFAKFNGVEKYWIHLFNKNDPGILVDGKIEYTVAILKQGQSTWFFVNDKLVCSFSAQEMTGYSSLETLEVTACADRTPGAYDVDILGAKIQDDESEAYAKYMELALS